MRMRGAPAVVIGFCAPLWAACGGSAASCPNDSVVCPQPAPSYAGAVAAIVNDRCLSCHKPGGQEAVLPFTTYDEVFAARSPILNQVYACRMPLAGSPQLTQQERTQLLGWLACGAPNN